MKAFLLFLVITFYAIIALFFTMLGYGLYVAIFCVGLFMFLVLGLLARIARGVEALKARD
jgi:hypothetical protein